MQRVKKLAISEYLLEEKSNSLLHQLKDTFSNGQKPKFKRLIKKLKNEIFQNLY